MLCAPLLEKPQCVEVGSPPSAEGCGNRSPLKAQLVPSPCKAIPPCARSLTFEANTTAVACEASDVFDPAVFAVGPYTGFVANVTPKNSGAATGTSASSCFSEGSSGASTSTPFTDGGDSAGFGSGEDDFSHARLDLNPMIDEETMCRSAAIEDCDSQIRDEKSRLVRQYLIAAIGEDVDEEAPQGITPQRSSPELAALAAQSPVAAGPPPVVRAAFFVALPAFAAYSALFSLQGEVKKIYGVSNDSSHDSRLFSFATSFVYLFNLIFRCLHNVCFDFCGPRRRVYIALSCMVTSMAILTSICLGLLDTSFFYLFIAYALGGMGIGTFEANLLSSLTWLGHKTKKYTTLAVPVGICSTQLAGYSLMAVGVRVSTILCIVTAGLVAAAVIMYYWVPVQENTDEAGIRRQSSRAALARDIADWRRWLPQMWHLAPPMAFDMLCLSSFAPGVLLFIYDKPQVAIIRPPVVNKTLTMPTHIFFAIYTVLMALGGLLGRALPWSFKRLHHPASFIPVSAFGVMLCAVGTPHQYFGCMGPILASIGAMMLYLGDGLIYGTICRSIDERVPQAFNLAAVSCWLFVGDFGSVLGANMIPYIRDALET